jgi:diadenosine tetraphosphatase ApaH/serine/threonine PP2A family protein phosphatase
MDDIKKSGGADGYWSLGDTVGYGPDPHQCLEVLRGKETVMVTGNHDWAVSHCSGAEYFNEEAGEAVRWTAGQLSSEEIAFLSALPGTEERLDFTLVHGSPRDPIWEYLLSSYTAEENLDHFRTGFCLIGHSHLPLVFECSEADECQLKEASPGVPIKLDQARAFVNPGSVGQPRDGDPRASYAVYDSEAKQITFKRVTYDIQSVQSRMARANLPSRLISRLSSGR